MSDTTAAQAEFDEDIQKLTENSLMKLLKLDYLLSFHFADSEGSPTKNEIRTQFVEHYLEGLMDIYAVLGLQVLDNFQDRSKVFRLEVLASPSDALNNAGFHLFEALGSKDFFREPLLKSTAGRVDESARDGLFLSFFDRMLSREAACKEPVTARSPEQVLIDMKTERLRILREMYREDVNEIFDELGKPHLTDMKFKGDIPWPLTHPPQAFCINDEDIIVDPQPHLKLIKSAEQRKETEIEVGHRRINLFKPRVRLPWEKALVRWGQI
ncbi:hypothetical protein T439DRAFT_355732 [Meredithblackwellia eburnea MCA 4105]